MGSLLRYFHKVFELTSFLTMTGSIALILNGCVISGILFIYLFPLILHKFTCHIIPLEEGISYIEKGKYNPWLTSYRIQKIFLILPILEKVLMCVPGLFPLWLRAWGSKVGKGVEFPPSTLITDRSFLNIGDNVLIGNEIYFSPHLVKRKNMKALVFLKTISIGKNSFIGGKVNLFAGSTLSNGFELPAVSYVGPNMKDSYHKIESTKVSP